MSVETVQLLAAAATLVGALVGGYWVLARFIIKQFKGDLDSRFVAQEKARKEGRAEAAERLLRIENNHHQLETAFLRHQAVLPVEYVRKEDHVRYETVVNAKLDAVASKIDLLNERSAREGK